MERKKAIKIGIISVCILLTLCLLCTNIVVVINSLSKQSNVKLEPHINLEKVLQQQNETESLVTDNNITSNALLENVEENLNNSKILENSENDSTNNDNNKIIFNKGIAIGSSAKGMCVLESTTNTVLYEKNMESKIPMASTTKIITAIVAIENCEDINEVIKVAKESVGIEGTSIYLKNDEEISVKDLLIGLMLASGNDAATALACHVGGTQDNFVKLMNEFANKVGAVNTHFDNPHGLDSKTHFTTAYDLAKMTGYALENEIFKEIASTKFATIKATNKNDARYLKHKNKLLFSQVGCVGVKTGFTDNAGRCLVNATMKDDMTVVSVVLNCVPMFEECEMLTDLAYKNYVMKEFVLPYNYIGSIQIESGDKPNINVVSIKGYKKPILKKDEDKYKVEYKLEESRIAPIDKNEIVGEVNVKFDDRIIYTDKLYSIDDVSNIDLKYMLKNIMDHWFN